jgi:hypothetical protein
MPKLGKQKIKKRLESHLTSLRDGKDVSKRDMKSILTQEQLESYEHNWSQMREMKQDILSRRDELKKYEEKLRIADATMTRYENTKSSNRDGNIEYRAESKYEKALEHLEELMGQDSSISMLLDREFNWTPSGKTGPDQCSVPRFAFSQSHQCLGCSHVLSKRAVKISVFESAIDEIDNPSTPETGETEPPFNKSSLDKLRKLC